jgi:DNA modification methylase
MIRRPTSAAAKSHRVASVNRVVRADNLAFMPALPDGCCDLIYADPPFNCRRVIGQSGRCRLGFEDRHANGLGGYLAFLEPRLAEMRRLLSLRGTLYVHLDWRAVHHVRILLDGMFGEDHFLNEIIWSYRTGGRPGPWFARNHQSILVYARQIGSHTFQPLRGGEYRTRDLRISKDGRPYKSTHNGPIYFHPEGPALSDVWEIPFLSTVSKERTGYPTQKPEALLERIIRASSREGDLVADYFCGSGTTLAVACRLGRRWLGCDSNPAAVTITKRRLRTMNEVPSRG